MSKIAEMRNKVAAIETEIREEEKKQQEEHLKYLQQRNAMRAKSC